MRNYKTCDQAIFFCIFFPAKKKKEKNRLIAGYSTISSLRSMAVLSIRAQERRSREIRARSARERAAKPREKVASAPISSRFVCPRPPLLLSAPNQNRHATQAILSVEWR